MEVKLSKRALKRLKSFDHHTRERITSALRQLEKEPLMGDIKPILPSKHHYRLRIGDYRAIFHAESGIITIDDIDSRGQINK